MSRPAGAGEIDVAGSQFNQQTEFAELLGVGHYAADQVPAEVNALLLEHLKRYSV